MKARLPKMLLAALLAAMTSAYAADPSDYVIINPDGTDQYYFGGDSANPIVITDAAYFGSGISTAPASTVNIGYSDKTQAHNAYFALNGDTFDTPNALFIGGPGWDHKLSQGYFASHGELYLTNGATLNVATHVTMGSCKGADSWLYIQGGSTLNAVNMDVSSGGGYAYVHVGAVDSSTTGHINLSGNLTLGVNMVELEGGGEFVVHGGSTVNVDGATSVGYGNEDYPAGFGELNVNPGGELTTDSLLAGVANKAIGYVRVHGTLNVTGSEHDILIGYDGGEGDLYVSGSGGVANLGTADLWLGNSHYADDSTSGILYVSEGGTLNLDGTIYVGGEGATIEEGESVAELHGTGSLTIESASTVNADRVEVASGSKIRVYGRLNVDETPDEYGIQGVRLYDGAILSGSPENGKGSLTFSAVREDIDRAIPMNITIENFTLTQGTTFKACCNNHLQVGDGSTLTFGDGVMHITNGVLYIDGQDYSAGTITGSGKVSVLGNTEIENLMEELVRNDETSRLGIIDTEGFLTDGGYDADFMGDDPSCTLKLVNNSAYEIHYSPDGVTVINPGYGEDAFEGFYLLKVGHPAEDAYPTFDRNQREVYDVIKQLEEGGQEIPEELRQVIEEVLDIDGKEHPEQVREALDFLGAVNYSVMMHNQIDGNISHQRMLRNRSMVGRNLRHHKGCTDVYAAGFYDGQRLADKGSHGEGYRRHEWGGLVGADTCINENLRIGADLAYGRARINPTHNQAMHQDSFYWDVYAQLRKGNWRSITALGMGIHSFDLQRGIGRTAAKANNVKGYSLNFTEEVSYDWKVTEKTTIQPFAALDLTWNTIKAFTDGDLGPMNIHVQKQEALAADLTLGGRYIHDFALLRNVPDATWYAQLGVAVSLGKTDTDMDCNFVGAPDTVFDIQAANRDRVGLDLGAGITIPVSDNCAIFANGEAILRGDSHNINAQIGVQVAF